MAQATSYSYETKIKSHGYHVCKNTTWINAKEDSEVQVEIETDKASIKVDPYACAINTNANILISRKHLKKY